MTSNSFAGYPGLVWNSVYSAMNFYINTLNAAASPASTLSISQAMLASLLNASDAITAQAMASAWQQEAFYLTQIEALPLPGVTPTDAVFYANRLSAYNAAYPALNALLPSTPFPTPQISIANGNPIIPDMGLLTFYSAFNYETAPSGLTGSNLVSNADACTQSFLNIATSIGVYQGLYPTGLVDVATRQYKSALMASHQLDSFTSGSFPADVTSTNAWNQIVSLTALCVDAQILIGAPFTFANQQNAVIRYAFLSLAFQIAAYILNLDQPTAQQVNVTTLRIGESLMDVAARTLGDFEAWTQIATLNGLSPPYVGSIATPGIAAYGSQLILPTPGASVSSTGNLPSYEQNFLGTDLYIGPINGDMPPWTGDFQTITGYQNLAWALGRRLQTTLTRLIYHPDYGSRVPPEIGNVQDNSTSAHIAAYGSSAVLSDPRVARVLGAKAILQQGQTIAFEAIAQPKGLGQSSVKINQVIQ